MSDVEKRDPYSVFKETFFQLPPNKRQKLVANEMQKKQNSVSISGVNYLRPRGFQTMLTNIIEEMMNYTVHRRIAHNAAKQLFVGINLSLSLPPSPDKKECTRLCLDAPLRLY